jgi:hypothetical protein
MKIPTKRAPATSSTQYTRSSTPYVHLNDGTVRLTLRWKPKNYANIRNNIPTQTTAIEQILDELLTEHDAVSKPHPMGST